MRLRASKKSNHKSDNYQLNRESVLRPDKDDGAPWIDTNSLKRVTLDVSAGKVTGFIFEHFAVTTDRRVEVGKAWAQQQISA